MSDELVRVVAPHFVAGLVVRGGVCVQAAPILWKACYMKSDSWLRDYFRHKGWKASIIPKLSLRP